MDKRGKAIVAVGLIAVSGVVMTKLVLHRKLTVSKDGQDLNLDFSNYQARGRFGINMRANGTNVNTWFNLPGEVAFGKTVSLVFGREITDVYLHHNDIVDFTLFEVLPSGGASPLLLVSNHVVW